MGPLFLTSEWFFFHTRASLSGRGESSEYKKRRTRRNETIQDEIRRDKTRDKQGKRNGKIPTTRDHATHKRTCTSILGNHELTIVLLRTSQHIKYTGVGVCITTRDQRQCSTITKQEGATKQHPKREIPGTNKDQRDKHLKTRNSTRGNTRTWFWTAGVGLFDTPPGTTYYVLPIRMSQMVSIVLGTILCAPTSSHGFEKDAPHPNPETSSFRGSIVVDVGVGVEPRLVFLFYTREVAGGVYSASFGTPVGLCSASNVSTPVIKRDVTAWSRLVFWHVLGIGVEQTFERQVSDRYRGKGEGGKVKDKFKEGRDQDKDEHQDNR